MLYEHAQQLVFLRRELDLLVAHFDPAPHQIDRQLADPEDRALPMSLQLMTKRCTHPCEQLIHLEQIFDKFYRVQNADQVRAGTGLGLAISRGFVEAMQGTISAANRTDRRGAVFTITL